MTFKAIAELETVPIKILTIERKSSTAGFQQFHLEVTFLIED